MYCGGHPVAIYSGSPNNRMNKTKVFQPKLNLNLSEVLSIFPQPTLK